MQSKALLWPPQQQVCVTKTVMIWHSCCCQITQRLWLAFTQNVFAAAPVLICRDHLAKKKPKALLINSGIANAGTGEAGKHAAYQSCQWVAQAAGITPEEVLPFSTGVIMQPLCVQKSPLPCLFNEGFA